MRSNIIKVICNYVYQTKRFERKNIKSKIYRNFEAYYRDKDNETKIEKQKHLNDVKTYLSGLIKFGDKDEIDKFNSRAKQKLKKNIFH